MVETIMKSVGKRIVNPAYPIINVEVRSNIKENNTNDNENAGAAHIMKLSLFLRKGNAKQNNAIGITKNSIPPHADNPNDKKNAATINLIKDILPLLNFNPEMKRYMAKNAKKSPRGSDLNQPNSPLENIGTEIEKINAAYSPVVVPPKTRTKAKITNVVKEPNTNGRSIVKS